MCTLFIAFKQDARYPLIVAANRDEALDRPASGPRIWEGTPRFLAPRDDKAGGTWMGLNAHGVFAGITNRFMTARHPDRRSRGELVTDVLRLDSAQAVCSFMRSLDPHQYNAFHLFYADAEHAFISWSDGEGLLHSELGPGLHTLTERSFSNEPASRAERLQRMWKALKDHADPAELFTLLQVHADEDPFSGTCIHAPAFNYGTRSSTVALLSSELSSSRWFSSEGPAHSARLVDNAELLFALR